MTDATEILAALSAPFDPGEVKSKPAVVSGNRALALFYVDARVIQDRLDDVLGVEGWQDDYTVQDGGSVVCKLSCRISGEWIAKMDVGSPSEQPDDGDKLKAAFSDALKRAAVKFGVGRYLYRVPSQWCDYDQQKRQFVKPPQIPASVAGKAMHKPAAPPAERAPAAQPTPEQPTPQAAPKNGDAKKPMTAAEFIAWLDQSDAKAAGQGLVKSGVVIEEVAFRGREAKFPERMEDWGPDHTTRAVAWVKEIAADLRKQQEVEAARKEQAAAEAAKEAEQPPENAGQFLARLRTLWELKWKARMALPELHKFFLQHGAAAKPQPFPKMLSEWTPAQVKKAWEELLPRVERQIEEAAAQVA